MRNRAGTMVYGSFRERPASKIRLSPFFRALQAGSWLIAVGLPIYFLVAIRRYDGEVPMHFDFTGNVTRTGPATEAIITLVTTALCVIGLLVLARYPRILNFPVMLTEDNVQQQYRYGIELMTWVAAACAGIMVVMAFAQLSGWSINWIWWPLGGMFVAIGYYIWRRLKAQ